MGGMGRLVIPDDPTERDPYHPILASVEEYIERRTLQANYKILFIFGEYNSIG